jgi:uncharacterized membrane protein (DUF4010 family)
MLEFYVERLSKVEFLATVKFILVTVIILPVLPNHEFTQFHINPFEIRPAIGFALLFVILSVVTGFVKSTVGNSGLLAVSAIVGVSDIDPFILSLVQGV